MGNCIEFFLVLGFNVVILSTIKSIFLRSKNYSSEDVEWSEWQRFHIRDLQGR